MVNKYQERARSPRRYRRWSPAQKAILQRAAASGMSHECIAEALGRTKGAVLEMGQKMGVKFNEPRYDAPMGDVDDRLWKIACSLSSNARRRHNHKIEDHKIEDIPADITPEWVYWKLVDGECEYTGLPFDFSKDGNGGNPNPFYPTLDRIDEGFGYHEDNVQVVIWAYNRMRGRDDEGDILRVCEAIVARAREAQAESERDDSENLFDHTGIELEEMER